MDDTFSEWTKLILDFNFNIYSQFDIYSLSPNFNWTHTFLTGWISSLFLYYFLLNDSIAVAPSCIFSFSCSYKNALDLDKRDNLLSWVCIVPSTVHLYTCRTTRTHYPNCETVYYSIQCTVLSVKLEYANFVAFGFEQSGYRWYIALEARTLTITPSIVYYA